jgi:hypothetical protein
VSVADLVIAVHGIAGPVDGVDGAGLPVGDTLPLTRRGASAGNCV